jgi:hypothetical protein
MPARKPEECDTILVDAINKGDLEAAIALYEPNARFVQESGEVVTGHPAIREEMKGFLCCPDVRNNEGLRSRFEAEIMATDAAARIGERYSGERYSGLIGDKILKYRAPIGIVLLAITAYFGYGISKLTIGTSCVDFFPRNHPYVQLYHTYRRYGEAQTLTVMLQMKQGDIYNRKTLEKIQDLTFAVDLLPAVIHQSVRSLASYRVTYASPLPGNLVSKTYMYPKFPRRETGSMSLSGRLIFTGRRSCISSATTVAVLLSSLRSPTAA